MKFELKKLFFINEKNNHHYDAYKIKLGKKFKEIYSTLVLKSPKTQISLKQSFPKQT